MLLYPPRSLSAKTVLRNSQDRVGRACVLGKNVDGWRLRAQRVTSSAGASRRRGYSVWEGQVFDQDSFQLVGRILCQGLEARRHREASGTMESLA